MNAKNRWSAISLSTFAALALIGCGGGGGGAAKSSASSTAAATSGTTSLGPTPTSTSPTSSSSIAWSSLPGAPTTSTSPGSTTTPPSSTTPPATSPPTSTTPPATSPPPSTTPPSSPPPSSPPPRRANTFSGQIPFQYILVDASSATTSVSVKYSTDSGATWTKATRGTGGDGTTHLSTSPSGDTHTFVWDSTTDLGQVLQQGVMLAVKPRGKQVLISSPFDVDDRTPGTTPSPSPAPSTSPSPSPAPSRSPAPPPRSSVTIDRGPYIQATTTTSTTICWRTTTPTDSLVEFGPGSALGTVVGKASANETVHAVTITGLSAGSSYSYRVTSAGSPVTQPATFATAADPSALAVTCLVVGDTGTGVTEQMQVAQLMANETCDLILHTGDVIYPSGEGANYDPFFFAPYGNMIRTHPIYPAVGNHDYEQPNAQPYQDVFPTIANNPAGSRFYYSFDWGDVHFVSIDTWVEFRTPGPALTWLENDLAATTRRWKVVYMHVPLYSVGHHGDDAQLQQTLGPTLENNKVDLLLTGHDHDYERSAPIKNFSTDPNWQGIPYIVTGGGGGVIRNYLAPRPTTLKAEATFHYTKLTFTNSEIKGTATRSDGSVIETFSIPHQ